MAEEGSTAEDSEGSRPGEARAGSKGAPGHWPGYSCLLAGVEIKDETPLIDLGRPRQLREGIVLQHLGLAD